MGVLDGLNEQQLAAAQHVTGPQLVIAGAGTGKTQVITRRIAHLIAEKHARPSQILALTFTDKAAREMEDRLFELIGWNSFEVPVMTFNAFGSDLLGRFASHIGRSVRGGLINDTQKSLLLQQHLKQIKLDYYGPQEDEYEFAEGIIEYIGRLQNLGVTAPAYSEYVAGLKNDPQGRHPGEVAEQVDLARLFSLYEDIKREYGVYDYNDQLAIPLKILQERPNLAERLAQEYHFVLVDEYQDTNPIQDALLRTFVGRGGNIFAVGDDDQAIYGFRGAEIGNILAFSEHFELAEPAVLVQNYRSGQAILDGAYKLIQHNNPHRLEDKLAINKRLVGQHDDSRVRFVPYRSAADELEGVGTEIATRVASGEAPSSIAVLAATHAPLRAMAVTLARRGTPYAISTTVSIFEQPELLALWHLLKWLAWQANDDAVSHTMLGPFFGWSSDDFRMVLDRSREDLVSLEEALRRTDSEPARQAVANLEAWRGWARELPVSQLAFKLVFETGLAETWQRQAVDSPRMVKVFDDLQRLFGQMQDFETVADSPRLEAYLQTFPKPPALEVSEPVGDAGGVQLLTVHAAKGLEFETVYLIGCSQRSWSAGRGMGRQVPAELEVRAELPPEHEFRRLMYVAVTRAKLDLIISAPVQTAAGAKQQVSPFIAEILGESAALKVEPVVAIAENNQNLVQKLQRFYPLKNHLTDRLPFETEDGWLDLSVTALGGYDFCPFEFYLQYVLKISQPIGPQLGFGTALHRVFEAYYKTRMGGKEPELSELRRLLNETWSVRGYTDAAAAEADLELAQTTLARFFERENRVKRQVIGSEVPVRFEVPEANLRLRGKIDALFEREQGFEIRDFKTGRSKFDPEKLAKSAKDNFQLRSYALACTQLRGAAPDAVVLDYVVTMVEGEAKLSAAILNNHRDKLGALADRIRSRDFAPNPSAMHQCAAIKYYGTGEADEFSV